MRYFVAALAVTTTLSVMAQDGHLDYEDTPRGRFQQCIRESQPNPHPNLGRITVNRTQILKRCEERVEVEFRQTFSLQELTGIVHPAGADVGANAKIVSFNFDWPSGINAIVETSNISSKSLNGVEVVAKTDSTIRLTTEPRRRGIAVRWHDSKSVAEILPKEQGTANIIIQKLIAQVVQLSPDFLVNSKGELTKIDNSRKVQEQADKLFLDAAATLQGHFKNGELSMLQRMVEDLSSPEQLQARASARWDLEVGQWHRMKLSEGALNRIATELTLTALGDFSVNGINDYVLEARVPCNIDDEVKKCVKLAVYSTLEPGELDHINEKLGEGMIATEVINDHDLSLVIEPDTLLPHRIEENILRKLAITRDVEGGEVELESDKRVTQYRYLAR